MRRARWEWVAVCMFAASVVMAQSGDPTVAAGGLSGAEDAPAAQGQDACIQRALANSVSADSLVPTAKWARETMDPVLTRVLELQRLAIQSSDSKRLQCINKAKIDIEANIQVADAARRSLQEAMVSGTPEDQKLQAAKTSCAASSAQAIGASAEACSGSETSFVGATQVQVRITQDLGDHDPAAIKEKDSTPPPPATEASPFSANFNL